MKNIWLALSKLDIKIIKSYKSLIILSFFVATVFFFFTNFKFIKEIEYKIIDAKFKKFSNPNKPDSNIVLVTIDDSSIKYCSANGFSYPWPRMFYATVVNYLNNGGAKAIIFDLQFYENDIDRSEISAEESDFQFAQAIAQKNNVYLGSQLNSDNRFKEVELDKLKLKYSGDYVHEDKFSGFISPIKALKDSTYAFNPLNILADSDGVFRRVPLFYNYNGTYIPQMPLKVYSDLNSIDSIQVENNWAYVGGNKIPLDKDGNYFINWYKKNAFKNYPFKALLSSASAELYGFTPTLSSSTFKDKIIIIGSTAAGLMDDRTSPISKHIPGLEIWATILSNFLQRDYAIFLNPFLLYFFFYVIVFSTLVSLVKIKGKMKYFNFGIILLIFIVDYFLWIKYRIIGTLFLYLLTFLITYLIGIFINFFLEENSKIVLRNLFNKYISSDLIEILLDEPNKVELGGKEVKISVLFTDIYNFTDLSEQTKPLEIIGNLNKYLHKLTEFVLDNKGFLDKFTGDGIMALYGTPVHNYEHSYHACLTAVKYKKFYSALTDEELKEMHNKFHVKTRIAIHTGYAVVGNIGSSKRMDYTAIGDTVNLSARLEAINKIYHTEILVSENTYKLVKDKFLFRELDTISVKGRKGATTIYELIDEIRKKPNWIKDYEKGLNEYRNRNWKAALKIFEKVIAYNNDGASKELKKRCQILINSKLEKWNSVYQIYSK